MQGVGDPGRVQLLGAAGLVETLQGDGPFTVFAPTNDAFAALDEATLEAVGADTDLLTSVLLYHVLDGEVLSTDLEDGAMVPTLNGASVTISLDPVMVNNANVVIADLIGTNGVIHVIDAVLIPPADDAVEETEAEDEMPEMEEVTNSIVDIAVGNEDFSTLVELLGAAGLVAEEVAVDERAAHDGAAPALPVTDALCPFAAGS